MSDYNRGWKSARNEIVVDAWTVEIAREYLRAVGEPINAFDAGFTEAVRTFVKDGN